MLKIAIADDHQLFRKSLKLLINSFYDMEVIMEAKNGVELIEKLANEEYIDIVLLDIQMPEKNGIETSIILNEKYPDINILILSQLSSIDSIHKVIESGANGFFTKNTSPKELEKAINNLHHKGFHFEKDIKSLIKEYLFEKGETIKVLNPSIITKRELEIIELVLKEFSGKEIANQLYISLRTVEVHKKNLMKKTKSKNFIGVLLYAINNNYILLP